MQNLKTRTSGHQMRPLGGVLPWSIDTQKIWARLGCFRGDRGPRELDNQGVLVDFVRAAS